MNVTPRPQATCHPEEPHLARGLCSSCYGKERYWGGGRELTREARLAAGRRWRDSHPRERRNERLKARYGITVDEYEGAVAERDGRCDICKRMPDILHVDHSDRIRGLLCGSCNRGLGLFGDDIERLESAITYLNAPLVQGLAA